MTALRRNRARMPGPRATARAGGGGGVGRSAPNSCNGSRSTVGVLRTGGPPDFRRASVRPQLRRTSLSAASKARKPAYPLGPRFAGPRQGLAGGCAPSDPPNGNGTS